MSVVYDIYMYVYVSEHWVSSRNAPAEGLFSQVTENTGNLCFRNRRHATFEMDTHDFKHEEH